MNVGDLMDCDLCHSEHEVIGHMGGIPVVTCPLVRFGDWWPACAAE